MEIYGSAQTAGGHAMALGFACLEHSATQHVLVYFCPHLMSAALNIWCLECCRMKLDSLQPGAVRILCTIWLHQLFSTLHNAPLTPLRFT